MANIVRQQGPAMKMSLAMVANMNLKKPSPISISQMKRWTHVLSIMCVISLYFFSSQLMTYCDQQKSVTRFLYLYGLYSHSEKKKLLSWNTYTCSSGCNLFAFCIKMFYSLLTR